MNLVSKANILIISVHIWKSLRCVRCSLSMYRVTLKLISNDFGILESRKGCRSAEEKYTKQVGHLSSCRREMIHRWATKLDPRQQIFKHRSIKCVSNKHRIHCELARCWSVSSAGWCLMIEHVSTLNSDFTSSSCLVVIWSYLDVRIPGRGWASSCSSQLFCWARSWGASTWLNSLV